MTPDPPRESPDALLELLRMTVELIHPAFVDPGNPRTWVHEFYHQFRKLWDRGVPVGLKLGHLLIRPDAEADWGLVRVGERGESDVQLAVIRFVQSNLDEQTLRLDQQMLKIGLARTIVIGGTLQQPRLVELPTDSQRGPTVAPIPN